MRFCLFTTTQKNTLNQIVAFAAYFGPYFLVPATFRFAGSALASIGGGIKQAHQGAFGALSKYRKQQPGKRYKKAQTNQLYSGRNALSRTMGKIAQGATLAPELIKAGGLRTGLSGIGASSDAQNYLLAQEVSEKGHHTRIVSGNEDVLRAMLNGESVKDYKKYLSNVQDKTGKKKYSKKEVNALTSEAALTLHEAGGNVKAAKIAALRSAAGTTMFNSDQGMLDMYGHIDSIAGDNSSLRDNLVGMIKTSASNGQNYHIGSAAFGDLSETAAQYHEINNDKTLSASDKQARRAAILTRTKQSAYKNGGPGVLVNGKSGSVELLQDQFKEDLSSSAKNYSTNKREFLENMAMATSVLAISPQSPSSHTKKFRDKIMGQDLESITGQPLSSEMITDLGLTADSSGAHSMISTEEGLRSSPLSEQTRAYHEAQMVYANSGQAFLQRTATNSQTSNNTSTGTPGINPPTFPIPGGPSSFGS